MVGRLFYVQKNEIHFQHIRFIKSLSENSGNLTCSCFFIADQHVCRTCYILERTFQSIFRYLIFNSRKTSPTPLPSSLKPCPISTLLYPGTVQPLPNAYLISIGILLREQSKKHIRLAVRRSPSGDALQYLNYLKQTQSVAVEVEAVDEEGFQKAVSEFRQAQRCDEISFLEQKLANVLTIAHENGCSDIHFEPSKEDIKVFTRRLGQRTFLERWPHEWLKTFVNIIKIKSELDIQTTATPLNGQFSYSLPKEVVFCRVSILPSVHGDCIVLRLHSPNKNKTYNMEPLLQTAFAKAVWDAKPGLWILSGPIGNGKTTSYYELLNRIKAQKRVFSFEEPIEIFHPHLLQFKATRDLLAEPWMRILVRQSVNVVGFGEVRSAEQLKFVVNAALTGHCVLTTFHANSVNGALQRLANFHYAEEKAALFLGGILHQHWDETKTEERSLVLSERIFQH